MYLDLVGRARDDGIGTSPIALPPPRAAHQHRQQPLLKMQSILRLREDEALFAFDHFIADFQAAVGGQTVQHHGGLGRFGQQLAIDFIAVEIRQPLGLLGFLAHVGAAYAWNTAGAIAGSLAGGFVLLPILTAPGCWRMVGILLAILGVWTIVKYFRQTRRLATAIAPLAMACIVLVLTLVPDGPTAAWRHSGIGVGRVKFSSKPSPNEYREWVNLQRNWTIREMEGVESCIGITARGGLAFVVNGKVDGNSWPRFRLHALVKSVHVESS